MIEELNYCGRRATIASEDYKDQEGSMGMHYVYESLGIELVVTLHGSDRLGRFVDTIVGFSNYSNREWIRSVQIKGWDLHVL